MLALDPELKFAGRVAGVLSLFEHGDNHDLDLDRSTRRGSLRRRKTREKARQNWEQEREHGAGREEGHAGSKLLGIREGYLAEHDEVKDGADDQT